MRIQGKISASVTQVLAKVNEANDGQWAIVDFTSQLTRAQASELFGEEFDSLAFGATVERPTLDENGKADGSEIVHLADTIKPGKKVVMEHHIIKTLGLKDNLQPQILGIRPIQGLEAITLDFRIGFPVKEEEGILSTLGSTQSVDFDPVQMDLPGTAAA